MISRGRSISIRFTCAIETELTVSLSNGFSPTNEEIGIDLKPQRSSVNLSMQLFRNETFTEKLGNLRVPAVSGVSIATIQITDMIYVGIDIDGDNSANLILQAEKCWATPR